MSRRVELHTHLEGSLTPVRLVALAERYGQPGLLVACLDPSGKSYQYDGFAGFLRLYRDVTSVLRTPRDFREITLDLGEQLAADNVDQAEVTVSYGVLLSRGIDPRPIQQALHEAAQEVWETRGIRLSWLPDAVRQWGLDKAWRAWEAAATCGRDLGVVGFGLGGDETNGPAADFAPLFADVAVEGLGISIHAGEIPSMGDAGRHSVREAVEICGATRIGHGLAAASDPLLLALLAARGVHVEACPRSNLATGAIDRLEDHPLRIFLAAGVPCSLNTDDRGLFGLDLAGEYDAAREAFDLTDVEVETMAASAREAAFAVTC